MASARGASLRLAPNDISQSQLEASLGMWGPRPGTEQSVHPRDVWGKSLARANRKMERPLEGCLREGRHLTHGALPAGEPALGLKTIVTQM
ncbi:hypothetical protein NDU88_007867 [Pleurodeles waltl]|uniref:Uncharacterized protein n=1 Tax=Pleurodeles waltl TaxID=8319 RepID=A0AAV7U1T8_PLEWA|nr:hypothetical protein NDU88_007867 [Pleurodeles waltl]